MLKDRFPIFQLHLNDRNRRNQTILWGSVLIVWLVFLSVFPDPRPLSAPDWAVKATQKALSVSEAGSRAITTIVFRGLGLLILGVVLVGALKLVNLKLAVPVALVGAPLLSTITQIINYGYLPVFFQFQLSIAASVLGVLLGFALFRKPVFGAAFVAVGIGLFFWATATGVSDDLYEAARQTSLHILENADEITKGDEAFLQLMKEAFAFAEDNSHGGSAVEANQAAILALGVILGEQRVAEVAKRKIDLNHVKEMKAIRKRVTLEGRKDLVRHFWVSAALTVLSDESRSMTVGITKELMDSNPGGSGFSFVDLVADQAGTSFAVMATRNEEQAKAAQLRIRGGAKNSDFFPNIEGLPEGISKDEFEKDYGGLGGAKTKQFVDEIKKRLSSCQYLDF